jgi:ribosomal protein S18 acetylase RimI-like enzyme
VSGVIRKAFEKLRGGDEGGGRLRIRPARRGDLARLREITAQVFGGVSIDEAVERRFGTLGGRPWQERKAAHVDMDYRLDPKGVLVAVVGGNVVGYVTTSMDRANLVGYIANLAVEAEHQNRGIGRRLVAAALERFREAALNGARIATLDTNAVGRHLYPSMGFEKVAQQIYYFKRLD